ncbi:MAG TPA: PAS domain S-box protein, partial [Xanthomonadaceae bacterium]|nr:PAS domain S-box protein [Xanthomonadaceae bacterium]
MGGAWIFISDRVLIVLVGAEAALDYQTWKGWLFVAVTAAMAFAIVRRLQASERARRRSETEARAVFEQAAQGMALLAPDGRWLSVNQRLCDMLGCRPEHLLGRPIGEFVDAGSEAALRRTLAELEGTSRLGATLETRLRAQADEHAPVRLNLSRLQDGVGGGAAFVAVIEDVSAELELQAASRLAAVAFETHEAMIITDAQARILRVNRAFEELTGYSQAEVFGCNPSMLGSGRHPQAFFAAIWEALTTRGRWEGEVLNRARDGSLRPVWERITAVRDDRGAISHYVAVQLDLREAKSAQQAINRLSLFDALTGLPNRDAFLVALEEEIRSLGASAHSAMLLIDLDDFKQINEALGHECGDAVLRAVAELLGADLEGYDVLSRHAADEFLLLYACRIEDPAQAAAAAARRSPRPHGPPPATA